MNLKNNFVFDEKAHAYFLNDKPMLGVTSVLGVISKPALIQWSANEAVKYIRENGLKIEEKGQLLTDGEEPLFEVSYISKGKNLLTILEEAKTAHRKKKESAGDFGTEIHLMLETWINEAMKGNENFTRLTIDDPKAKAFNHFLEWVETNKVKFLASEKQVYSEKWWFAGTLDFICKIGDKTFLGDFKSSSGIYWEMFLQTSAYQLALEEREPELKIDGHIIVNLTKKGEINVQESYAYKTNVEGFKSALQLYKVINDLPLC